MQGGKITQDILNHLVENNYFFDNLDDEQVIKKADKLIEDHIQERYYIGNFDTYMNKEYGEYEFLRKGGESLVYLASNEKKNKIAVKRFRAKNGLFRSLINKVILQNLLFPEAPYVLKGFTKDKNNKYQIILEQPYFEHTNKVSPEEVKNDMVNNRGFKEIDNEIFISKDYVVRDLHGGNVLKGRNGELLYIDPIIRLNRNNRSYADFLK